MKKILLVIIALTLAFIFYNNSKSSRSVQQQSPSPSVSLGKSEITGWFAAWDNDKAGEELPGVMDKFTVFSPMLYRVMADGSLGRHSISNWDAIVSIAREHNKPIAPVITDESDAKRIQRLLYDDNVQKQFIADMLTEAKEENYSGWSVDIEKLTSKDRDAFSNFVINMSNALHKNDLKLYMIAYGRDADESYDPALSHDFKVFGEYADQVQLMTYGYNNEYTDPGGETPLAWYRAALEYTLQNVPREKIVVGLSTHGNDWTVGKKEVEGMTYQEVEERIAEQNPDISYDKDQLAMVAKYTNGDYDHVMYFENAGTLLEKIRLARDEYGINKFAFWRLSAEDPALWKKL